MSSHGVSTDGLPLDILATSQEHFFEKPHMDTGLPASKFMTPFCPAEVALSVQLEKMRVIEAMGARDTAVHRLENAYISVRQKTEIIDKLKREVEEMKRAAEQSAAIASKPEGLEIQAPTPPYSPSFQSNGFLPTQEPTLHIYEKSVSEKARLAALPLPSGIPDDALKPILIPHPYTFHEFLGNATGSLKASILQQLTTHWCPEREEHGYLLTPVFKCSTNPRVITAHRWAAVDVIGKMVKPTECFYNKDGKWYYAGVYKAFRMEDLSTKEWDVLSPETTQAIIKETTASRKNVSPQNLYEIAQLYAAGALKVACIGLQCVGFSNPMYRTILEQANNCARTGKWRNMNTIPNGTPWISAINTDTGYALNMVPDGLRLNLTPNSANVSVIDEGENELFDNGL
ncbi:hypothetical protein SERLADRAFT_410420 [Serpula lacrymans var. lacrymans S7.9]|uniref:DUF6697 domain-containing protein n=1 Tax=Serpula lacrymans var. lacrymans (strain S7.9) TaxID=578457 RepID=F8P5R6_SERL9|nr:uncharacterized protein SERLADRAFT_410420 [Serpula lacrymans var. lacrymans S7.9]EGO21953.1 hypothetical protein SERLADRAFT_410420 [Serpula lacrymans var. lacrymans S7.9]